MSTIARIAVEVDAKTAQFERGMAQAAKTAETVGRSLQRYVTLPLTAIAGASVYVASDYNASMNRVAAVTQATGEQVEALSDQAKELGRTTRYSAGQAADAMGFLGMAGFKTEQIMSAMPSTLQLAAAAQMDLAQAADITSNILTGYGMSIEELSDANDVLVASFTGANTDLSQLGIAMKYVGPVASGLGFSFKDTAAMIGLLGNAGIQGSQAGTTLRRVLSELASPTKESAKLIKELGLNLYKADGSIRSFVEIMREFERVGAGTTEVIELFGVKGTGMAAALSQGSEVLEEFNRVLDESGGLAERVADKNMEGLSGALISMKSVLEGVSLEIGEALTPAIVKMVDVVKAASTWFIELEETQRNTVVAIGALAAATGPLLIVLGQVPKVLGAIRVGLTLIATHPIVFAVVAIGAAIAGVITYFDAWDKTIAMTKLALSIFARAVKFIFESIVSVVSQYINAIGAVIAGVITYFDAWEETIIGVKAAMSVFGRAVELTFSSLVKIVGQYVEMLMAPFKAIAQASRGEWAGAWDTLKSSVTGWGEVAVSIANDAQDAFGEMHETITSASKAIRLLKYDKEIEALTSSAEELRKEVDNLGGFGGIYADDFNEDRIRLLEIEERLRSVIDERDKLASSGVSVTTPDIPEAPELPAPNVAAIRPMEIPMIAQQEPLELPEPPVWDNELMSRTNEQLAQQHDEWLRVSDATNQGSESLERYYAEQEKAQAQQTTWNEKFAQTQKSVEGFGGVMGNVAAGIYQNWDNVGQFLRNWRRQIIAQFIAVITKAAVVSAVLSAIPGFGQANAAISAANIFTKGVKGIFGLAEGGIVTQPTLAMIGEGRESEAIIPLSKLGDVSGGGRPVEVHTHVEVGGREVAEYVTKDIMNNLQRRAAV